MGYSRLTNDDLVVSSELVSVPIWSGNRATIPGSELVTGSQSTLSAEFYLDLYNKTGSGVDVSEVQFAVAYADADGSGSLNYNNDINGYSRSRTNYGQYRSLVLGDEETAFYFNEATASANFWAISIDRARYKEQLMPGSLELKLLKTGSKSDLVLVDGGKVAGSTTRFIDSGRVYSLYKQNTSTQGQQTVITDKSYGFFLPDIGVILLDCALIGDATGRIADRFAPSTTGKSNQTNAKILIEAIGYITLRSAETVSSNYVFVRAKNSEFNYSMNPSNITSTGEIRHSVMINSPETYITTVGLYNDNQDLLAVAKLSRPLPKSFSKEALIRIKLNY